VRRPAPNSITTTVKKYITDSLLIPVGATIRARDVYKSVHKMRPDIPVNTDNISTVISKMCKSGYFEHSYPTYRLITKTPKSEFPKQCKTNESHNELSCVLYGWAREECCKPSEAYEPEIIHYLQWINIVIAIYKASHISAQGRINSSLATDCNLRMPVNSFNPR
jgi:hypothetical protein